MSWDSRQTAMLRAMGLRVWSPPLPRPVEETDVATMAAPEPVSPPAPVHAVAALPPQMLRQPPQPVRAPAPVNADERSQAIARMDWDALRDSVAQCRACGLCESRKNTVFGVGNTRAHWMIVGEAPGQNEDLQGEPFVGQAGKLLDNMLAALRLNRRERVYIANVLKCRPPGNRNPEPEEITQCEPFLRRQVDLLRPKIILAMGRFAVQTLLQTTEPVGRLRGRVHRYHDVPLVVTYHPAYLLRNLPDKAKAWADLCLAQQVMRGLA